jgi:hypothetical protein
MPKRRPIQSHDPDYGYQKRDPWPLIRAYRFDANFKKAIDEANKRKPKQLCELLRSDEPLSAEHREALAKLIKWHLQVRSSRGRPRASAYPFTPLRQYVERQISKEARAEIMQLRKEAGGKRLPSGTIDQVIDKYADLFAEIYEGELPDGISLNNVRNAVKRGTKRAK